MRQRNRPFLHAACVAVRRYLHTHTYTRHTLTCIHACARGYVCVCVRAYTRRTRILRRTRMAQTWQQRMPHLTQHATRIIRMSGPYIIESRMQRRRAAKSTPQRTLLPLALSERGAARTRRRGRTGGSAPGQRRRGREGRAGGKERWTERGRTHRRRWKGREAGRQEHSGRVKGVEGQGAAYQSSFTPEPIATQLLPR